MAVIKNTKTSPNAAQQYSDRSEGAYVDFQHLASFQLAAKHLPLEKNRKAISFLSGPYKTKIRGRGMEFEDVRQYQPGDDIRNIDWRVSARTGKAYSKVFHEEREKPVLIVVDQRQQMFFASTTAMKSVVAADLASYIAWAAKHKGDRVGALIFNDETQQDIRPRNQRKTVLQILHFLSSYNQQLNGFAQNKKRHINAALLELKRVSKPGTQIFIISDFADIDETSEHLLHDLAKHSEVVALQILDTLEEKLPKQGFYKASNGSDNIVINANKKSTRQQYQASFTQHQAYLQRCFGKYQIPLIPVYTHDNPLALLQHYFGRGLKPESSQIKDHQV
ncbi:MAG: DUF58 domain-containing protein [Pseudomonadales bacterium]|nr:DUF58 domain-containing protein [Pseudomonadales bacterium]